MSLPVRHIRTVRDREALDAQTPKPDRRAKAEFDSHMVMVRHLVDEADNRETAEHLFRGMLQQCKILAKRYDFRIE